MNSPLLLIEKKKEAVEATFDASNSPIFGSRELSNFIQRVINLFFSDEEVTVEQLKSFLLKKSHLKQVAFQTPRRELLFLWRDVNSYELLPRLRPNGYYTHLSALYFHGLLEYEPAKVFFNHEQSARFLPANVLEQSRIDNAFQKKQRLTTARTIYDDKEYWLLNGKQTGNYGVSRMKVTNDIEVSTASLERTLIDIAVRPAYAGGVNSVLNAYRSAQPKISIEKLIKTLHALNYVYPYYQSIGFYIENAGNYDHLAIQKFLSYDTFKYNFYLDYEMQEPLYSEKWRIYYPNNLI